MGMDGAVQRSGETVSEGTGRFQARKAAGDVAGMCPSRPSSSMCALYRFDVYLRMA